MGSGGTIVGRGFPNTPEPTRNVPALNRDSGIASFQNGLGVPSGNINVNAGKNFANGGVNLPADYADKRIFTFSFDLSNTFTDTLIDIPGSVVFFSGESGGTAAPVSIKFDNQKNDPIDLPYDRAISGIPFRRLYVTNSATQAGITAKITIIKDAPFDRVGLNG